MFGVCEPDDGEVLIKIGKSRHSGLPALRGRRNLCKVTCAKLEPPRQQDQKGNHMVGAWSNMGTSSRDREKLYSELLHPSHSQGAPADAYP
jgi:hypothetical protein